MRTHSELPSAKRHPSSGHGRRRLRAIVVLPLLAVQALFLVIAASTLPARALSFGSVSGVVRTLSGKPVPNALLTFARTGGGFTTVTGADGSYTRSLPFDDYTIQVTDLCFDDLATPITVDGAEAKDLVLGFQNDTFGHVCQKSVLGVFAPDTTLPLNGDDAVQQVALGFPFPFYGGTKTQAFISTNGFLTFTPPPSGIHASSLPLLDPNTPPDGIFPFWDDFVVDQSAKVRIGVTGTAPNRVEVIEWRNVAFLNNPSLRVTFHVALFEDGRILIGWENIGGDPRQQGSSATVGLRNGNPGQAFDAFEVSESQQRIPPGTVSLEFSTNRKPVAQAGADKSIGSGAGFTLDGTGTTDPDGTSGLLFQWTQIAGPATTIQDPTKAKTKVTGVKGPAKLTYQLRVIDPFGRASFDTVTMTVSKPK